MALYKKKDIPLAVLDEMQYQVEPLINSGSLYAHRIKDEQLIYHLITNNEEYDFFFKVNNFRIEEKNGGISYLINYKPVSIRNLDAHQEWRSLKEVTNIFNAWIDIIKGYEKSKMYDDDPILKSYQAEFESKFEIIDEDAESSRFDIEQQIYIDEYLEYVKKELRLLKEGKSEEEQKQFIEIESDASQIQKGLLNKSKKKIIQELSRLFGKARKISIEVFKKIAIDFFSEVTVKLLTRGH